MHRVGGRRNDLITGIKRVAGWVAEEREGETKALDIVRKFQRHTSVETL